MDKALDKNKNVPWKKLAKQFPEGGLEPGVHAIVKGRYKGSNFLQDAMLAIEVERGTNAYCIVPPKHRPYINQAVEDARELLVEDCLIEGTGMVCEREVETLEDMLAELDKIGYHRKDSRIVTIEGIERLKGEDRRKATYADIGKALAAIKHLAFEYDLRVLVIVQGDVEKKGLFPSMDAALGELEMVATTVFSIANTRDRKDLENAGYAVAVCDESYGAPRHKSIFVRIAKNQTGCSGGVFGL